MDDHVIHKLNFSYNKKAIVSYIIDESLVKLWNTSLSMRQTIKVILKDKDITVKEYNEKVVELNGWVSSGKSGINIQSLDQVRRGVSNYNIRSQEQIDRIISLNAKLRFGRLNFIPSKPLFIDTVSDLVLGQFGLSDLPPISFNRIGKLKLEGLSSDQIQDFLTKIKRIDFLTISDTYIYKLDLSKSNIKKIEFEQVNFKEEVVLPGYLRHLGLSYCIGVKFLKYSKILSVNYIVCGYEPIEDKTNFLKGLKDVRRVKIDSKMAFSECLKFLPSTIREVDYGFKHNFENIDLAELKRNLPNLVKIRPSFPIELAQKMNLRDVKPKMKETEEKFTFKPRRIEIDDENAVELSKQPELFEKADYVWIQSNKFSFDCLPKTVKEVMIKWYVNFES